MLQLLLMSLVFGSSAVQTDSPVVDLTRRENVTKLKQALARGEDPDAPAGREGTALHIAAQKGNLLLVMALVDAEASVDARDDAGKTPLMIAASEGFFPVAQILQEAGADVNAVDNEGISALMLAAKHGHLTIVKYLLRQDADLHLADNQGANAYDRVRLEGDEMSKDIAKLLRALGARRGKEPDKPANMIFVDKELAEPGEDGVYNLSELKNNKKHEKGEGPIFLNDDLKGDEPIATLTDYQSKRPAISNAELDALDNAIKGENFEEAMLLSEAMLAKELSKNVHIYVLYQYFQAQMALGQDAEGMKTLAKLNVLEPDSDVLYTLVIKLSKQYRYKSDASDADYQRAEQCLAWALEMRPKSPWEAMHNLMMLYMDWERFPDALKIYYKAKSMDPPPFAQNRFTASWRSLMSTAPPIVHDEHGGFLMIGPYDFQALRGKVVVLANWSEGDKCSKALMAILKRLNRKYDDGHLEIITMTRMAEDRAKNIIESEGYTWHHLFGNFESLYAAFDIHLIPTVIVIDHEGKMIYRETPCNKNINSALYVDIARAAKRARKAAKQKANQD